jgi:hypothetical protein
MFLTAVVQSLNILLQVLQRYVVGTTRIYLMKQMPSTQEVQEPILTTFEFTDTMPAL